MRTTLSGWIGAVFLSAFTAGAAPANDHFANAEVLDVSTNWIERSNIGATAETAEPLSTWIGGGKSVWWRYDAPRDGYVMVSTVGSRTTSYEELDTVIGVFVGTSLGDLAWYTYNDDNDDLGALGSRVDFPVQKGKRYYIAVDSYDDELGVQEGEIFLNYTLRDPYKGPDWILPSIDGSMVNSTSFHGQVTLVNVWATWCGPCRDEIPDLVELQNEYGRFGFSVVGISVDDPTTPNQAPSELVGNFAASYGINYPVVMTRPNWRGVEDEYWDVSAYPTTFVVDRNNNVLWMFTGSRDKETFANIISPFVFDDIEVTARQEGGEMVLEWLSLAGVATAQVERASSLDGSWNAVTTEVTDDGSKSSVRLSGGLNGFFRLKITPL
jgi:thiol-disulfide isomerase/thioredoxin